MRAGLGGGHGQTALAVEGVVEPQRGDAQVLGGQRRDQLLGLEGAVVAGDPGVVAADDEVAAAVVLTDQGVEHGLAGPGIAHGRDQGGQQDPGGREVAEHRLVGPHADLGRHVAVLGRATSGCSNNPSTISRAHFMRYSWARWTGLRVWNPTTVAQPRSAKAALVWAGVRARDPTGPESGSRTAWMGPATARAGEPSTRATPGWSGSAVP